MKKPVSSLSYLSLHLDDWQLDAISVPDLKFVLDSWCNDELVNGPSDPLTDPDIFKTGQRERILGLVGTSKCIVARAQPKLFARYPSHPAVNAERTILGYCVYALDRRMNRPVIHFVYVKADARHNFIADGLLQAAGVSEAGSWCTHMRARLREPAKARNLIYNKYLLDHNLAKTWRPK